MSELKLMAKYDGQEIPAKAWREIVMLRQECSKQQARIEELEEAGRAVCNEATEIGPLVCAVTIGSVKALAELLPKESGE